MYKLITHAWVRYVHGKVCISIENKEGLPEYSKVELEEHISQYTGWSIEDFESRAEELEARSNFDTPLYDPSKFEMALQSLVECQEAVLEGSALDIIDFWLDKYCLLEKEE